MTRIWCMSLRGSIVQDKDILKLLAEEAPLIEWKIMGRFVQGTTMIRRKKYSYMVPLRIDVAGVKMIAKAFMDDYERKRDVAT